MTLRTSLVIAGDASGAVAATKQAEAGMAENAKQAQALATAYAQADQAIDRLAAAQALAKTETTAAKAAFDAGEISIREYNGRLLETKAALSLVEGEYRTAVSGVRQLKVANDSVGPSLAQARAGYTNFGRQVQDVAVMLQGGANIGTVIAMQGGQVADSVAQMGGRFAGFAKLMAGPVGTAIIVVTSSLLNMVQAQWEAADAASENAVAMKQVELASSGLSEAQSVLGEMFDLTSGKLQKQNELLRLNAQLQAINLRIEADAARASAERARDSVAPGFSLSSYFAQAAAFGMAGAGDTSGFKELTRPSERISMIIDQVINDRLDGATAIRAITDEDLADLNISQKEFRDAIRDAVEARGKGATADAIEASLRNGILDPDLRRTGRTPKPKKERDDSARVEEFGEDTARRIANINDQFSGLPTAIERANKAMRDLDDIATDVERSKLPQSVKDSLNAAIAETGETIERSLNRPFDQYLEKSRTAVEIDRLLAAGRDDEAAALQIVLGLKDKMRPLDEEQLATILETVQAERQRALVLRDQRALIDANVRAVRDMRGAMEQTVADALRGRFSLDNILNSIATSYINLTSQRIVERMFGDTLRSIEEQARGGGQIEAAATKMATAMGGGSTAVTNLADAVQRAVTRIDGAVSGAPAVVANDNGAAANDNGDTTADGQEIVVTANVARLPGADPAALLVNMVDGLARDIGIKIPLSVGDAVKSTLSKLEKALPDAIAGAFIGTSSSRILLGDRGTGGMIGSALGGALGQKAGEKLLGGALSSISSSLGQFAGPIGSAVGGILGGLVGGMFKKTNWGSATITGGDESNISATGTNSGRSSAASSMATSVQEALAQIADEFGAEVGAFNVSIGTYKDKYRVSTTGSSKMGGYSGSESENEARYGLYNFGDDQAAAIAFATLDAIKDGALDVSEAVQKALTSTNDLNKAITEGLKVREVEQLLGGLGGEIEQQFAAFEKEAKERLRIARQYGFDVVKIEEINAKERLALVDQLMEQQVGSLQSLIDEMTSGSLYEGSAVDRRDAILAKIDTVKADADAGKEGAADELAQLLQDLNTVSKEVYGTTGGFAADQAAILDAARDTIAKANQRVQEAAGQATDLTETNAQLDESNDLLSKISSFTELAAEYLRQLTASSMASTKSDVASVARF